MKQVLHHGLLGGGRPVSVPRVLVRAGCCSCYLVARKAPVCSTGATASGLFIETSCAEGQGLTAPARR